VARRATEHGEVTYVTGRCMKADSFEDRGATFSTIKVIYYEASVDPAFPINYQTCILYLEENYCVKGAANFL
jgi:hypothetical protein